MRIAGELIQPKNVAVGMLWRQGPTTRIGETYVASEVHESVAVSPDYVGRGILVDLVPMIGTFGAKSCRNRQVWRPDWEPPAGRAGWHCVGLRFAGGLYMAGTVNLPGFDFVQMIGVLDDHTIAIDISGARWMADLRPLKSGGRPLLEAIPAQPAQHAALGTVVGTDVSKTGESLAKVALWPVPHKAAEPAFGAIAPPVTVNPVRKRFQIANAYDISTMLGVSSKVVDDWLSKPPLRVPFMTVKDDGLIERVRKSVADVLMIHGDLVWVRMMTPGEVTVYVDWDGHHFALERVRQECERFLPAYASLTVKVCRTSVLRRFAEGVAAAVESSKTKRGQRMAIDEALREDARIYPAFANARKAAMLAWFESCGAESCGAGNEGVDYVLRELRAYEAARGVGERPAVSWGKRLASRITDAYERARRGYRPLQQPTEVSPLGAMAERWGLP